MGWAVSNWLIAGQEPTPQGNDNVTAAPSGTFRTRDGLLNIAANKQQQFEALARLVGRPELVHDPRFAAREARKSNRAALTVELESALAQRTAAEWEAEMNRMDIPAGRVVSVAQALASPQICSRGLLQRFEQVDGVERPVTVARTGFKLSQGDPEASLPPPRLGQHTDEILRDIGYTADEIRELKAKAAV
jgi:CoA:oxalate CoA-transferase